MRPGIPAKTPSRRSRGELCYRRRKGKRMSAGKKAARRGACSSAVERPAHNWLRVGSNPTGPTVKNDVRHGAIVYRLGRGPFKAERRVQLPLALPLEARSDGLFSFSRVLCGTVVARRLAAWCSQCR